MKIFIASDHAGFERKKEIISFLHAKHEVIDLGPLNNESCDYPDFAHPLAKQISKNENSWGILVCGTGMGMSIVANRHPGIRAALCENPKTAELAREHNNANVLCLGAQIIDFETTQKIIHSFLETPFDAAERRKRRMKKIEID
ncbi:ribose 5-phosphate isomerase B [Candidatus Micrarchaeota archaeon]|nr:ribose 5-phosphate isomerase B [Candidatus Micrarchaeota archaeon]MBU1930879.1 ribose 5-phosphate isomerase B [Candidatus Micrarchaeota archaeon]